MLYWVFAMEIEHYLDHEILVITLKNDRLDAKDAAQFKQSVLQVINETKKYQVVFVLNKLNFIDSSGVGIFLSMLRFVNSHGGELKLAEITQPIRTILELISMHKIFEIFKTTKDAIESFKPNVQTSTK
jgi:anti-anti-sigma factor